MKASKLLVTLIISGLLVGCAERVRIRSYPTGAKAFLDDEFVGTTPAVASVPRSQVNARHEWRVEFRNCEPAMGVLDTRIGGGRIVGYIFTLGIVALFKGPRGFVPVDAALTGGDCETRTSHRAAPAPPQSGITIQQIVGDRNSATGSSASDGMSDSQRLAERLTTLRDLYNRKLISDEVYERESQKAIDDLR